VVGVGLKDNKRDAILVRVIDVKRKCPLNMVVGNVFEFKSDERIFCLQAFHRLYPYLLLKGNLKGIPFRDENGSILIQCDCDKGKTDFVINPPEQGREDKPGKPCGDYNLLTVSVENIDNKCRYHDSIVSYSKDCFASRGLCPDAFHAAYPLALALLYDANFNQAGERGSVTVSCPKRNGIRLLVQRQEKFPVLFSGLLKLLEKIFALFFYPVDKIYNNVSLTVISDGGACPLKYKGNEKFMLNIRDKKVMCPASFNSLFTCLVRMAYGKAAVNNEHFAFHCPDCQGAEYVLKKINVNKLRNS
jgi:uncharacterized repeat protein (TIGR04076 family)